MTVEADASTSIDCLVRFFAWLHAMLIYLFPKDKKDATDDILFEQVGHLALQSIFTHYFGKPQKQQKLGSSLAASLLRFDVVQ